METELQITSDGSHTLFVPSLNEHYHSINGAITEAMHIFINTGLHSCQKNAVSIFEAGFGTGLNAFLTLIEAVEKGIHVNYHAIELYPLTLDVIEKLNYTEQIQRGDKNDFLKIHQAEWNKPVELNSYFILKKIHSSLVDYRLDNFYDVIYFDAFAPDKQPELWSNEIFEKIFAHTNNDGILTTYSSKGTVKQALRDSGFNVNRLPGPPGKRHILKAIKQIGE